VKSVYLWLGAAATLTSLLEHYLKNMLAFKLFLGMAIMCFSYVTLYQICETKLNI
jgi:hypothetical protein